MSAPEASGEHSMSEPEGQERPGGERENTAGYDPPSRGT